MNDIFLIHNSSCSQSPIWEIARERNKEDALYQYYSFDDALDYAKRCLRVGGQSIVIECKIDGCNTDHRLGVFCRYDNVEMCNRCCHLNLFNDNDVIMFESFYDGEAVMLKSFKCKCGDELLGSIA